MANDARRKRARKLYAMADEMLSLAREIELDADSLTRRNSDLPLIVSKHDGHAALCCEPALLELARQQYAERRRRGAIFGRQDIFGEPAWDALLDLYVAMAEGRSVTVTRACVGAAVSTSTALRWLNILEAANLVVRDQEGDGPARVRLSEQGFGRVSDCLKDSLKNRALDSWQFDLTESLHPVPQNND